MSGNTIGVLFKVTTWGESHGPATGAVIDGCPPGLDLSAADIQTELDRRRPGGLASASRRREADRVEILRGNGLFVWLCAAAHVIAERMESDPVSGAQRPSLTGKASTMEVNEILAERELLYRRLADLAVDTTATGVEGVAEAICTGLGERFRQADRAGNGKEKK